MRLVPLPDRPVEIRLWSVAGETYDEVRRLAEDGVTFALASAAAIVSTVLAAFDAAPAPVHARATAPD